MNGSIRLLSIIVLAGLPLSSVLGQAAQQSVEKKLVATAFEESVAPLLVRRCLQCHQGPDPAGGLSLTTAEDLWKGGESGAVIDRDSLSESYLLEKVINGEMPPPDQHGDTKILSANEIALFKKWVTGGVSWPRNRKLDFFERTSDVRAGRDWWSLQPIVRPGLPKLTREPQPTSAIDRFVRAKLFKTGMQPAPVASPAIRLRRLHFVLTGLPPTADEIQSFVNNPSDLAWERAIDRQLASPQYGVRWARHWLDLVRYADTCGYERDQEKPFAWKYRDWVVQAFNSDMPFDQFIVHQLAGDELTDRSEASVIATGFLRLGAWNDEPNDPADYVYDRLEDLVHATSTAFLGMTVKCARCHAHKFDPITQEDYYRMASIFWAGPVDRNSDLGGPNSKELGFQEVLGWTDVPSKTAPIHLLKNGERDKPLFAVQPATLSMLPSLEHDLESPDPNSPTTQRRLQYARWIANKDNPLTARVFVNRLWQHHFGKAIVRSPNNFGFLADPPTHPKLLDWLAAEFMEGGWRIKRMHKLILMSETWQQSSQHPLAETYNRVDSGNRRWYRAELRRLDAETLRDSMLAASGEIDLRTGGPGFRPTISAEALEGLSRKASAWSASPKQEQQRRSVYTFVKRGLLPPMMTTFDLCDTTLPCGRRNSTTVPTQALTLLNHRFTHERSHALATRVCDASANTEQQIRDLWNSILRRTPSVVELQRAKQHVARQQELINQERDAISAASTSSSKVEAMASLAVVLFNSNEFLYID